MNYRDLAEKTESYIIEQRRWFHQHPELSYEEYNTTEKIIEELGKLGYEVHRFKDLTGCSCVLKGGKAAAGCKTVALRADIDALPVLEKTGLPFASENEGVMHACGHDNHISMLMGAAKMLAETKDQLHGNVKFLFQAAEESCHGAEYYVQQGAMEGVDAVMGQHIWGTLESPYLNVQPGNRMASCDNFTIKVEGKSAHGTQPHLGADALIAAATMLLTIQTIVSRVNDPLNPLVVNIGEMHAGQRFNIIANHAEMFGTVRTFNNDTRRVVEEHIRKIAADTASAMGVTAEVIYENYMGPVVNSDDRLNRIAHDAVVKMYGEEALKPLPMMMGSEDFAYYAQAGVPAVFGYLGSRNEAMGLTATNHNDHYNVDESALKRGAALYAQFAADYLEETAQ